MSNRRRTSRTSRSYADRLQRRSLPGPSRRLPARWRATAWLPATVLVLALAAEAGHLAAGYVEWPGSAVRGTYHVIAAGLLGLVAAFTAAATARFPVRVAAAVVAGGPALWLVSGVLAAPPYRELPVPVAAGITAGEIALAALLLTGSRTARAGIRRTP